MRTILASEFPHRSNKDGTIDSICPHCYVTIGRATWEADLDRMESEHVCNPQRLLHFQRGLRERTIRSENWNPPRNTAVA